MKATRRGQLLTILPLSDISFGSGLVSGNGRAGTACNAPFLGSHDVSPCSVVSSPVLALLLNFSVGGTFSQAALCQVIEGSSLSPLDSKD